MSKDKPLTRQSFTPQIKLRQLKLVAQQVPDTNLPPILSLEKPHLQLASPHQSENHGRYENKTASTRVLADGPSTLCSNVAPFTLSNSRN